MPKKKSLPPQYPGAPSSATISRPVKFRGVLRDFEVGQLCFVVARRYQGKGPVKLILHKAEITTCGMRGFGYGAFGHWVVSPGSLIGEPRSAAQQRAARINGAKSNGRPVERETEKQTRAAERKMVSNLAHKLGVPVPK